MYLPSRMILLSILASFLMVLGVTFFVYNDQRVIRAMTDQRAREKESYFNRLMELKSDVLRNISADYSSLEGMARFVETGDTKWAKENIETIISADKATACWVITPSGKLVFSAENTASGFISMLPFSGQSLLFTGRSPPPGHFFILRDKGVMEVHGSPIRIFSDTSKTGRIFGYFYVGRYWDSRYVGELERFADAVISFSNHQDVSATPYNNTNGTFTFARILHGIDANMVRIMRLEMSLPEIKKLHDDNKAHFIIGTLFVLLFVVTSTKAIQSYESSERSRKNLDEVQQLAGVGSWEYDLATGNGYWSTNHYRLFGMVPAGKAPNLADFFSLIDDAVRDHVKSIVETAIREGNDFDFMFRLADGSNTSVFRICGQVKNNDHGVSSRIIGSIQDVTDKLHQEFLREQLLKQKEMFITRLGHDLKTPLTPLVALLPLIHRRTSDIKLRELLELCLHNVNHMKELVVKTIKLARSSSPSRELELTDIPLAEAVDIFISRRADIIRKNGIHTENRIDQVITVKADRLELEEIFYNLISNAVKYSPRNALIVIDAVMEGALVTVCVRDTGIGLSSDDILHVFDEFFKADQSRHELDSSGLGLSICRRIVENHGGKIWAESRGKGHGTAIYFTMQAGGAQ